MEAAVTLAGINSSVSVSSFPESARVPSDQRGRCQAGTRHERPGNESNPATARNHTRWRAEAAPRLQARQTPPATSRMTKLLRSASGNPPASCECWSQCATIAVHELILTAFLSGIFDELFEFGQFCIRKRGVGGFEQRRHGLRHRSLEKRGDDALQR